MVLIENEIDKKDHPYDDLLVHIQRIISMIRQHNFSIKDEWREKAVRILYTRSPIESTAFAHELSFKRDNKKKTYHPPNGCPCPINKTSRPNWTTNGVLSSMYHQTVIIRCFFFVSIHNYFLSVVTYAFFFVT